MKMCNIRLFQNNGFFVCSQLKLLFICMDDNVYSWSVKKKKNCNKLPMEVNLPVQFNRENTTSTISLK